MEEKELVPKRRFKEHKDDYEWGYINWKDTVDISVNMVDPKNTEYRKLLHIGPGNIESFTGLLFNNVNTVEEDNLISGKFYFNKGDIIYGKINPQLGKYTYALYNGLASADAYVLNSKDELDQRFLFMVLQTNHFYDYSVSVSKRSGMPKINRDELNEYTFCAPAKEEQQKIGKFFKVLDERIANQERKIAKVKALKSAYLTEMFPQEGETVPKRRFEGFEGEWESFNLEEIAPLRGGFAFQSRDFKEIGVPIIRISNVLSNGTVGGDYTYYSELENDENFILPDGSILIAMSGATTGKVAILNNPYSNKVYQNQRVGYFKRVKNIDYTFISILVRTIFFMKQLSIVLVAGAQPNISSAQIGLFEFRIPKNIQEQQKIGQFFKNLDEQIATEESKLEKLKKMKEAYLEEMFV